MSEIKNINQMPNIRVFYQKTGRAKFISHLDINRCMQRALRRAEIPVWYTEGFNPHPYITFALPLSLGYESLCETMDLRITRLMSCEELMERLNRSLPEGIVVTAVALQQHKPEAIRRARYHILLRYEQAKPEEVAQRLEDFMGQSSILVTKHTKKGPKEVDIRPDVSLIGYEQDQQTVQLELETAAGIVNNVNPTLFLDAFAAFSGLTPSLVRVTRTQVLMENGEPFC